jgi:hypothetical protein
MSRNFHIETTGAGLNYSRQGHLIALLCFMLAAVINKLKVFIFCLDSPYTAAMSAGVLRLQANEHSLPL